MLDRFISWGQERSDVRALILTSTRTVPNAKVDVFSDYDLILVTTDIHPYWERREWLKAFGQVLTLYRDPIELESGFERSGNVIQFESGLKIDFTLWHVDMLRHVAAQPQLPDEFDAGYQVLLDKDHLTDGLPAPTYRAYIPVPPTESEYQDRIETFFLEAIYVAKLLWRDDFMAAKYIMDGMMKQESVLPVLEWHIEIDYGWSLKPGPYGRGLKQWLRADLSSELEATYVGAGLDANWDALYRAIALFRKVAGEVGAALGYVYPAEMDRRAVAYLEKVQNLNRDADSLWSEPASPSGE